MFTHKIINHTKVFIMGLSVVFLLFLGWSKAQAQIACGDTITEDTTLENDIIGCPDDGIVIGADNITLDCDWHTISGLGPDGGTIGIVVFGRTGVIVKKCTVEMFDSGIFLAFGSGKHKLFLNTVRNNGSGIDISDPDNILSWNTLTDNNAAGVFFFNVSGNSLIKNTANGNSTGFQVSGSGHKLISNEASNNLTGGFVLVNGDHNKLIRNISNDNSEFGVGFALVQDSINNTLTKNEADGNFINCVQEDEPNIFRKNDFGPDGFSDYQSIDCLLF